MVQNTITEQLNALATALVQVANFANGLSEIYDGDDWQREKLNDIADFADGAIDEVAKMIGHNEIEKLTA